MVDNKASVGDTVRGMAREVETELVRLIAYVNDEVVPEVRRSSSQGLRVAAEQLGRLAEHLDRGAPARPSGYQAAGRGEEAPGSPASAR